MKRLLFVTYYFPPSGGPGVQRSLKFVKYLPEFGWRPTVLTVRPESASWPDPDPDSVADIPEGTLVERTGAWDPYAWYARLLGRKKQEVISVGFTGEDGTTPGRRFARWLRANLFLPDARVGWVPFATARARALMRQKYDAVLTTGPPHSTHFAGLALRRTHGTPWLVDFRDPWTEIDFQAELPMTGLARALDAFLERRVLRNADGFAVVSASMQRRFAQRGYASEVIENGFDPADFEEGTPSHTVSRRRVCGGPCGKYEPGPESGGALEGAIRSGGGVGLPRLATPVHGACRSLRACFRVCLLPRCASRHVAVCSSPGSHRPDA